jgi:hypothetical protein
MNEDIYNPVISERANCGPTVLAAFLHIDTEPAIELISKAIERPWPGFTNVGHIRKALRLKGYEMVKIENLQRCEIDGSMPYERQFPTMMFIQITGPWMGKGWRSEYNHTHWAMINKIGIIDVNNRDTEINKAFWVIPEFWAQGIMPCLIRDLGGEDWIVKSCYEIRQIDADKGVDAA